MKEKKTNCKYCGSELEAKTTRREFCSNKCKVYWHRENKVQFNELPVQSFKKGETKIVGAVSFHEDGNKTTTILETPIIVNEAPKSRFEEYMRQAEEELKQKK